MKRSPMPRRRKAALPKVRKTPAAFTKYLCDELSRVLCMIDAGAMWLEPESGASWRSRTWWGKCAATGEVGPLQWAHIIGRGCLRLRHHPENAVALSVGAHKTFTHNPLKFRTWVADTYGDRLARLERMAGETRKVDLNEIGERLEAACVELGAREHVEWAVERARRKFKLTEVA